MVSVKRGYARGEQKPSGWFIAQRNLALFSVFSESTHPEKLLRSLNKTIPQQRPSQQASQDDCPQAIKKRRKFWSVLARANSMTNIALVPFAISPA